MAVIKTKLDTLEVKENCEHILGEVLQNRFIELTKINHSFFRDKDDEYQVIYLNRDFIISLSEKE